MMTTPPKLRIAVIGAGNMGINHVRAYLMRDDIECVGVVDTDEARAAQVAAQFNLTTLSFKDLPGYVDGVSVVVPSSLHKQVGVFCLENKIHCLIEKPLALTVDDSDTLIKTATKHGVALLVGHVEEYNQGFRELKKILRTTGEPLRNIFCQRFNYGSDRVTDADVILDLMIHDVGCVLDLVGENALSILSAHGMCRAHSSSRYVDMASATMASGDCIVSLQASRMSHQRHREFVVQTDDHSYVLDFVSQQIDTYAKNQLIAQTGHVWKSPLEEEIDHFVECMRKNNVKPVTSGERALMALRCVEEIQHHVYS